MARGKNLANGINDGTMYDICIHVSGARFCKIRLVKHPFLITKMLSKNSHDYLTTAPIVFYQTKKNPLFPFS